MSIKIMSQVWDYQFEPSAMVIALALADWADDDGGSIFPSVARIAWKTKLKDRAVQYHLAEFRRIGLLVPVKNATGGRGKTVEYRMDITKGEKSAPFIAPQSKGASDEKGASESTERAHDEAPIEQERVHADAPDPSVSNYPSEEPPEDVIVDRAVRKLTPSQQYTCDVLKIFGMPEYSALNDAERGAFNKAVKLFRQSSASLGEIERRRDEWSRRYSVPATPIRVSSRWSELALPPPPPKVRDFKAERADAVISNNLRVRDELIAEARARQQATYHAGGDD